MLGVEKPPARRWQKGRRRRSLLMQHELPVFTAPPRRNILPNNPTLFIIAWDAWGAERGGALALALRQQKRPADLVVFARAHSLRYQQRYSQLPAVITERHQLPPVTKPDLVAHFATG
jgi:hypothetical protein